MRIISIGFLLFTFSCLSILSQTANPLPSLKIAANNHFLVQNDGQNTPFFWLGDTGWKIYMLSKADVDLYLETRAKQAFNVIQGPVIIEFDRQGNIIHNGLGIVPLKDINDLCSFNDKYLEYYDYLLTKAESLGMYVCVLPFWAQGINRYSQDQLHAFGLKLANHFKSHNNLIWCVGGEAAGESLPDEVEALATGLKKGSEGKQLITVHPSGSRSSSAGEYWMSATNRGPYNFHNSPWLDFNMLQSGHQFNFPNYKLIDKDYALTPVKPTFESEYFYEDHPEWEQRNNPNPPRSSELDVRKGAYWSVFAGGFGYTYGHHAIWQVYTHGATALNMNPTVDWKTALNATGANQMKYIKALMLSRPFLTRIPDQSLLISQTDTSNAGIIRVTRDGLKGKKDASYILAYIPSSQTVSIATEVIAGKKLNMHWFNPTDGSIIPVAQNIKNTGKYTLNTPSKGLDHVLIIDDASKKYSLIFN